MFDAFPLVLAQDKPGSAEEKPSKSAGPEAVAKEGAATGDAKTGQSSGGGAGAGGTGNRPAGGGMDMSFMLLAMVGMFGLLMFFQMRAQKREKKQREAMLGSLKKGDKVQTIGGILGTVVEVRPDRVVLKTDENANIKTTFARSAIQVVINEGESPKEETSVKTEGAAT